MKLTRLALIACAIFRISLPCMAHGTEAGTTGTSEHTLGVGELTRSYFVHIPPNLDPAVPSPLVLVLHGGASNARNGMKISGFEAKADAEKFIAVFPSGTGGLKLLRTWNAGTCCGPASDNNVDDVGFIRMLIEHLKAQMNIDPQRIYVAGFSNGGMMVYRLLCEMPEAFAAAAVLSGVIHVEECIPSEPVPLVVFHGTADELVPYAGGKPKLTIPGYERIDPSFEFTVSTWAKLNRCVTPPTAERNGAVIHEIYSAREDGAPVEVYTIQGGKHAWPGGQKEWFFAPKPADEINATDVIWDFFKRFTNED
ncbi:MAG: prolyl oligopeptidase family serine peptidase [Candidatus Hydrogenedentes bacterium]|nr:prolyl oligopeptidase family serine peptidase [Candidatus Hydrogenedentota bacterium]